MLNKKLSVRMIYFLVVLLSTLFSLRGTLLADEYRPRIGTHGGQLVISSISDPKSFNPILAKETSTTMVTNYIFEGLTTSNGITTEVEPNLARSWELDKTGLKWIFHLRQDVKWFDGHPFTADDVVFTFQKLIYNPDIPNSARDIFTIEGKIFQVEKKDQFTVKFTLPVKFAPFLRSMSQEILPQHVLEKVVKEGKFNSFWGLNTLQDKIEVVGTGPFKLKKYLAGQQVVLERNPLYWRKDQKSNRLPYLRRIVILIVQSQDTALLKFKEGELDYYSLRGSDYPLLKPEERGGNFTVYNTGPAFGTNFLVFNQNRGKDPESGKSYLERNKLNWFKSIF